MVDTPIALQDAENRGLATPASPAPAPDADGSEGAFVDLDLAAERAALAGRFRHSQAQTAVKRGRGIMAKPGQFGRAICRDVAGKKPQKIADLAPKNFARNR